MSVIVAANWVLIVVALVVPIVMDVVVVVAGAVIIEISTRTATLPIPL